MKRRKPKAERKERPIMVRVTDAQKETLKAAAQAEGLELSAWMRSLALKAAAGRPPMRPGGQRSHG